MRQTARFKKFPLLFFFVAALVTLPSACRQSGSPSAEAPGAAATPGAATEAARIIDKFEEAVGGAAALDQIKSYSAKGTLKFSTLPQQGTIEMFGKDPGKSLIKITLPNFPVIKKGFDGETHWVQIPQVGVAENSPSEITELERDSEIYRADNIKRLYESLRLEGKGRLHGREVYIIEGKPAQGPAEKLLFDTENNLLLRWDIARKTPRRGTVFVKIHLEDYRDVGGVKTPFSVRYDFESFDMLLNLEELKHNVAVDDALFKKPTTR